MGILHVLGYRHTLVISSENLKLDQVNLVFGDQAITRLGLGFYQW